MRLNNKKINKQTTPQKVTEFIQYLWESLKEFREFSLASIHSHYVQGFYVDFV